MSKVILVSGSIAYDFIMKYDGLFKNAILKNHLSNLNIAFTTSTREMNFGGCSPNIAYGIKLLGGDPVIHGVAGKDFKEYEDRLHNLYINTQYIGVSKELFTASAHILTDKKENQITIFSPGAMSDLNCDKKLLKKDLANIDRAILSPDTCERTIRLAKILINAKVPYIFDPGQMTPAFSLEDLLFLLKNAEGFIANEYEIKLIRKRLGIGLQNIVAMVDYFIETRGEEGAILRFKESKVIIPAVRAKKVIDPTGCGDAFRAGLLVGLSRRFDFEKACKMGALIGTYSVENPGTQNYHFTFNKFSKRFKESFQEAL